MKEIRKRSRGSSVESEKTGENDQAKETIGQVKGTKLSGQMALSTVMLKHTSVT